MSTHTFVKNDTVVYRLWLVMTAPQAGGGVRATRQSPSVDRDERAMYIELTVPKALFETPTLRANIDITSSDTAPPVIDVQAAEAALRGTLGVDIELRVINTEEQG